MVLLALFTSVMIWILELNMIIRQNIPKEMENLESNKKLDKKNQVTQQQNKTVRMLCHLQPLTNFVIP